MKTLRASDVVEWAVDRWNAEVKNRPLQNIHRRSLDDAWRQVIRQFGGDDEGLCGPRHDELLSVEAASKARAALAGVTATQAARLSDEAVAEYLGCTADQIRVMRMKKWTCPGCAEIHPTYPQIIALHSPCCKAQRKCAECGNEMPNLLHGHQLGLICDECYDAQSAGVSAPSEVAAKR